MASFIDIFGGANNAEMGRQRQARALQAEQARLTRVKERREKRELESRKRVLSARENSADGSSPINPASTPLGGSKY